MCAAWRILRSKVNLRLLSVLYHMPRSNTGRNPIEARPRAPSFKMDPDRIPTNPRFVHLACASDFVYPQSLDRHDFTRVTDSVTVGVAPNRKALQFAATQASLG